MPEKSAVGGPVAPGTDLAHGVAGETLRTAQRECSVRGQRAPEFAAARGGEPHHHLSSREPRAYGGLDALPVATRAEVRARLEVLHRGGDAVARETFLFAAVVGRCRSQSRIGRVHLRQQRSPDVHVRTTLGGPIADPDLSSVRPVGADVDLPAGIVEMVARDPVAVVVDVLDGLSRQRGGFDEKGLGDVDRLIEARLDERVRAEL